MVWRRRVMNVCLMSNDRTVIGGYGDGTFRNPVIASDFSDPDPVRVGDDYFMVTSTFETSPGVTVLHSKDLVNWTIAGSVFSNLTEVSPAFSFREMKRYNEGVYAPSIRYHDGMFYVYVNLFTDGMFVGRTSNPFGEWEVCPLLDKNGRPLLLSGWTDPCPLWDDDGKAYLTSSNPMKNWYGYLFEMSSDGLRLLDADVEHMKIRDIVYQYPRGGTLYSPNHSTEGNKLYKRNGYYYIVHIEFLDGGNGAGTYIYRSRNIYGTKPDGSPGRPGDMGEYEMRRIDAYSVPYRQELPGQGGFVDTPDGRWYWIAQFNRYGSDGRTPCLLPVSWVDDWPVIGTDVEGGYGKMAWRLPKPITSLAIALPHGSDDFRRPCSMGDGRGIINPILHDGLSLSVRAICVCMLLLLLMVRMIFSCRQHDRTTLYEFRQCGDYRQDGYRGNLRRAAGWLGPLQRWCELCHLWTDACD